MIRALLALAAVPVLFGAPPRTLTVRTDSAQAEAVLAILDLKAAGKPPTEAHWRALFQGEGYLRMKSREESMGRTFEEAPFRAFVDSEALLAQRVELRRTLEAWRVQDFQAAAGRANAFLNRPLPPEITLYFVIKPRGNWFVVDARTQPKLFLALSPGASPEFIQDMVAHELHHVGYYAAMDRKNPFPEDSQEPRALAREHLGNFAEGFATLAQAGSWDRHPVAAGRPEEKARWDRDCAKYGADVARLEAFFGEVLDGKLAGKELQARSLALFGPDLGPWYTVGWRMCALVEQTFGRERLKACMDDLGLLLHSYNEAARMHNRKAAAPLPAWSERLLEAVTPK